MPDLPQYQLALVAVLAALLYAVPTLIAVVRTHHNRHAIFALNILLGWTFFGWAAALIWSLTAVNRALQGVDGKGGKLFHLAYFIPVIVFGVIAGYFLWGLDPDRDPREIPSVMIDQPVPEFDLAPIEGMEGPGLATADLRNGQVTLVNFFASWCLPCLAEHPILIELVERDGVRLVGINYKNEPQEARAWLAELGNPYARIGADTSGRVGIEWGVYGLPETFVIDKQGRIRYRHVGPIDARVLEREIRPRLRRLGE